MHGWSGLLKNHKKASQLLCGSYLQRPHSYANFGFDNTCGNYSKEKLDLRVTAQV